MNTNLRGSKLQFLEPGEISVLEHENLVSLVCQKVLEGQYELEVRSRCDVIVPEQRVVVLLRHQPHGLVEMFAHHYSLRAHGLLHVYVF